MKQESLLLGVAIQRVTREAKLFQSAVRLRRGDTCRSREWALGMGVTTDKSSYRNPVQKLAPGSFSKAPLREAASLLFGKVR